MLSVSDQTLWRRKHIPYRVRAAIARLDMWQSVLQVRAVIDPGVSSVKSKIYWRCATDSIWEGRLAATRWLIEFVGVSWKGGTAGRPNTHKDQIGIDKFNPGRSNLFDLSKPDAIQLASVWKGCSQASSHATHDSNHPPVNESELSRALTVIVSHLQDTVYKEAGENIRDYVLEPPPKR